MPQTVNRVSSSSEPPSDMMSLLARSLVINVVRPEEVPAAILGGHAFRSAKRRHKADRPTCASPPHSSRGAGLPARSRPPGRLLLSAHRTLASPPRRQLSYMCIFRKRLGLGL